jgi:predicted enzyme related to lactoylglutathione lyase
MATVGFVIDCAEPEALARFWAAALGWTFVGSDGPYSMVADPGPGAQRLLLQKVAEAKVGKNRMHLDVHVADIEAEAQRLATLGARRLADAQTELGSTWIVMADPEGNEFCVCDQEGDC